MCKDTNKRGQKQTCLHFAERQYLRRSQSTHKRGQKQTCLHFAEREYLRQRKPISTTKLRLAPLYNSDPTPNPSLGRGFCRAIYRAPCGAWRTYRHIPRWGVAGCVLRPVVGRWQVVCHSERSEESGYGRMGISDSHVVPNQILRYALLRSEWQDSGNNHTQISRSRSK